MNAYLVMSANKEIGRVLAHDAKEALSRAKACWPKHRVIQVLLLDLKKGKQ
jgi:hypothetical protein